jgi:hypothetical protein
VQPEVDATPNDKQIIVHPGEILKHICVFSRHYLNCHPVHAALVSKVAVDNLAIWHGPAQRICQVLARCNSVQILYEGAAATSSQCFRNACVLQVSTMTTLRPCTSFSARRCTSLP